MEKALSAYTDEHIKTYFESVKSDGLSEHGFPRLTANLGILIARGIRRDLLPLFIEMMSFCCENIPTVSAANNFSVREIISAIWELEKTDVVSKEKIDFWKNNLSTIDPYTCYDYSAKSEDEKIHTNWLLFSAVSEFFKQKAGFSAEIPYENGISGITSHYDKGMQDGDTGIGLMHLFCLVICKL
jgi:hypothetical protein